MWSTNSTIRALSTTVKIIVPTKLKSTPKALTKSSNLENGNGTNAKVRILPPGCMPNAHLLQWEGHSDSSSNLCQFLHSKVVTKAKVPMFLCEARRIVEGTGNMHKLTNEDWTNGENQTKYWD